jgi:photosystem II stability/assembly factor-like uncharacterized protein
MKRIYASIHFLLFCLISFSAFTQISGPSGWTWQNPKPQGNLLMDVHFADAQTGWSVGDYGTILSTSNGGTSWQSQASGTTNLLHATYFTDAQTGWAVGINGTILKTTNGGSDWSNQSSGTTNDLYSVFFTNANTGWAVGNAGILLHTTNGVAVGKAKTVAP